MRNERRVVGRFEPIREGMVVGFDAYTGDTGRALSQSPKMIDHWANQIADSISQEDYNSGKKDELIDSLDRKLSVRVRQKLTRRSNRIWKQQWI